MFSARNDSNLLAASGWTGRLPAGVTLLAWAVNFFLLAPTLLPGQQPESNPAQSETNRIADQAEKNEQDANATSATSETNDELPKYATWRFGDYGDDAAANGIYRLAYSPNGKFLATRNQENTIAVYDVAKRNLLCEIDGHEYRVTSLQFAPDSQTLMTSAKGLDEKIKIWEPMTGKLIREIDVESTHSIFSENGRWIFALQREHVSKFDAANGKLVSKSGFRKGAFQAKAVTRDGRYVFVSHLMSRANITKRIDIESESSVILPGPNKLLNAVTVSPDNRWVAATFRDDPRVRLWDMSSPNDKNYYLAGHKNRAQSIAISPDNRFLVSTSWDQTSIVWDLVSRSEIGKLEGHTEHINSSAFAPDSLTVATGSSGETDSSVIVWDLEKAIFPQPPKELTPDAFQISWNLLGSSIGRRALDAVNDLRHSNPGDVFEFLGDKLQIDNEAHSSKSIEKWIADLDSPKYAIRQTATSRLIQSLANAESLLRAMLETDCSPEVRHRIMQILSQEVVRPPIELNELRRSYRAIHILELMAAGENSKQHALDILKRVSLGHRHLDIAREAASAAKRISERNSKRVSNDAPNSATQDSKQ